MLMLMVAMIATAKDIKTQKTNEEKLQKAFEKFGYKAEKTTKEAKIPVHENEECDNM